MKYGINIFFACLILLTTNLNAFAQGTCATATPIGALDPCLPNQTFSITGTNDAAFNLASCSFDGDEATWVSFTIAAPSTGITIDVADWGGCSGFACATDITGALYASTDGTCGTLSAVDDCIDFTGGAFNLSSNGPFMYNALAVGTYFLRLSEEDDQGGNIELQIHAIPLTGDSPTNPIDLATANGNYCNYTADGNDCAGANDANSCIGTVDNTIFYSFTVDAMTVQPVTFGLENIICDGNMQMVVVSADCSASQGTGGTCGVTTGAAAPQLSENLALGDYLLVVDGVSGQDCSWTLSSSLTEPEMLTCAATYTGTMADVCAGVAPTFTFTSCDVVPGGSGTGAGPAVDLDLYLYNPGGNPAGGAPPAYIPNPTAGANGQFPIPNTDLTYQSSTFDFGQACVATLPVTALPNATCDPYIATYFMIPYDYTFDLNPDPLVADYGFYPANMGGGSGTDENLCQPIRIDIMVYPDGFTIVATDDGTTCGTPTAELRSADATVCETLMGAACGVNGDQFDYDFSTTATATALATAPAACVPTYTGSIACSNCPECDDPCFTEYTPTATNSVACATAVTGPMTGCDDGDPCTANDMQVLGADGAAVCIPCAGTPVDPPLPSLTCPPAEVNTCDGTFDCMFADLNPLTDGNAVTDTPIIGGTAAFATDAAGVLDLALLAPGGTYTLTLNYEENGCLGIPVTCTFTAVIVNDADGGQF